MAASAHTLVGMGTGDAGGGRSRSGRLRVAFLASFLTAAPPATLTPTTPARTASTPATSTPATSTPTIPASPTGSVPGGGLTLIRPPGIDPPGGSTAGGADLHGRAVWLGEPDAPLYRLDDERWLLPSPRRAEELARDLRRPPARDPARLPSRDPARGRGHEPGDLLGRGQALDPHSHGLGHDTRAGTTGSEAWGWLCVMRSGAVVARVRMVPGEGATLPGELAVQVERLVRARVDDLAIAAAAISRPWWKRWQAASRANPPDE